MSQEDSEQERFLSDLNASSLNIQGIEILEEDNTSDDSNLLIDGSAKKHTVLDTFITQIGMGKFQRQLLVLCGLGWLADNMWLQCIAVILPNVQLHFKIPDNLIGFLSSSVFSGMMFGALFWGVLSDTRGRKQAFNLTLAVTAFFGIASSFAQDFPQLCFLLFLLGFGVGGNMPVDGALFLEFIPKEHQYLLTFLSVFFSLGAVLTSVVAYFILPPFSCPEGENLLCDANTQNNGWRYMLAILGTLTFLMLVARMFFFRLQESPKYLISNNRQHDAVLVLRKIAKINGTPMQIRVSDFPDAPDANTTTSLPRNMHSGSSILNIFSIAYLKQQIAHKLVSVRPLFGAKWITTTLLVWSIWGLVGFAYTMFNVFLLKYLEYLGTDDNPEDKLTEALRKYLIYSISGVPGSVIGAWLIETKLGRKGTMAFATFGTSLAVFFFTSVRSPAGTIFSSAMVSFLATLNYAVIYGYTPEVFEARVRGTACGISSAVGRIAGIIAPIITGTLLTNNFNVPLYVSATLFGVSGVCMILLPIETRGRQA